MTVNILVLGGGIVGEGIAFALKGEHEITIADHNEERLHYLKERLGVNVKKINAFKDDLAPLMGEYEIVSGALPGRLGMKVIRSACKAGVDLVDNSFMEEDFYSLDKEVKDSGITVVPDSGVAPGLSNIIVGKIASDFGPLEDVDIKVGGLPEKNIPPLGYKVVFSPLDTLDEYTRKVQIVEDWKIKESEPGDGLEYFFVNNLGSMEAFYTNGLRSLIRNIKARNMAEKTIRFRGHLDKIKFLGEMGLLDEKKIAVEDSRISPKEVLASLLLNNFSFPEIGDILYMEIKASPKDSDTQIRYSVFDKFDKETGISAMARTTGFTNASIVNLLFHGTIKDKGIVAPEIVGGNSENFDSIVEFLREKGVNISANSTEA